MKRRDLIRHLETHGCVFLREGGSHTVYVNRLSGKVSTIPRDREINDFLEARAAPRPSLGGTSGEGESLFIVLMLFHRRRRPQ